MILADVTGAHAASLHEAQYAHDAAPGNFVGGNQNHRSTSR